MFQKTKNQVEVVEFESKSWEADLRAFNHSLFQTPEWILAMSNEHCVPVFLNFVKDTQVVGKISGLICCKGWLKGKLLYCYASPALKSEDQSLFNACHEALYHFAIKKGISRIVIGSYDQQTRIECKCRNFYLTSRYEYVVPLGEKSINFSQNLKRNIKKAETNKGVFFENTSEDSLNQLLKLIEITRSKRKSQYQQDYNPFYMFNMNPGSLKKVLRTGIAYIYNVKEESGEILCTILNIEKGQQSFNLLAGSTIESYSKGFSSYIDYQAIKLYQQKGFLYYNLGGGTGDNGSEGLERSKSGKGGVFKELHGATTNYIHYPGKFLNPFLRIGRALPRKNKVVVLFKQCFLYQ